MRFHGGCYGCSREDTGVQPECRVCCYYQADWDLKMYNDDPAHSRYEADLHKVKLHQIVGDVSDRRRLVEHSRNLS